MQYISPLYLMENPETAVFDKRSLLLAKKKMLAELDITGAASITINGQELTKNDIVNLFDNLQQTNDLNYHIAVAADPVLLRFLEHNLLENGDTFKKVELYADEAFIEWASPFYYESFTRFGNVCISGLDDDAWATMFANPLLLNYKYGELAWDFFENELLVDLGRLENARKEDEPFVENVTDLLCDVRYVNIMRKLPEARFGGFWDKYAFAMMNASVLVFNKGMRDKAETYINNALQLATSWDVREEISRKQAEMDQIKARSRSTSGQKFNWWWVRAAFLLLYFFSKAATCNNDNNTYNFQNTPVYIDNQRVDTSSNFDSIMQKIRHMKMGDTLTTAPVTNTPGTDGAKGTRQKTKQHTAP